MGKRVVAVQGFGWREGSALGACLALGARVQDQRNYFGLKKGSRGYQEHDKG